MVVGVLVRHLFFSKSELVPTSSNDFETGTCSWICFKLLRPNRNMYIMYIPNAWAQGMFYLPTFRYSSGGKCIGKYSRHGVFGHVQFSILPFFQDSYNTPLEHTPGNPTTQLWKDSLCSLLGQVKGCVPKVCWNNLRMLMSFSDHILHRQFAQVYGWSIPDLFSGATVDGFRNPIPNHRLDGAKTL